ncbi:MAG TPA: SPOR domain-containing protein, partial [Longimicrobiaceae bacterium]
LIAALAAAYALWPHPGPARAPRGGPAPPPVETPQAPTEPAGGSQLAWAEWYRVTNTGSYSRGDTVYVVILASFTPDQLDRAREIRDAAREKGYNVGLANSAVYRELRDGYVALVAGPYATRGRAEEALAPLRGDVASDAFLKRVTLRRP